MRLKNFTVLVIPVLLVIGLPLASAQDTIYRKIISIGNTFDMESHDQLLKAIEKIKKDEMPATLILNGDLFSGRKKFKEQDSASVYSLITKLDKIRNLDVIVLPGDRDWANSGKDGLDMVELLEETTEELDSKKVKYPLDDSCPGPEEYELDDKTLLIVINSQWFNHPYDKPIPKDADCKYITPESFFEELEEDIEENPDRNILIAAHYPLKSVGPYGGQLSIKDHIFPLTDYRSGLYIPLPVLGSIYAAFRQNIGTPRDLINKRYESFNHDLHSTLSQQGQWVFLSSHEYSLQAIQLDQGWQLNSGGFIPATHVKKGKDYYAKSAKGLVELDLYESGRVAAVFWESEKGDIEIVKEMDLYGSGCQQSNGVAANQRVGCKNNQQDTAAIATKGKSHVRLAAGAQYKAGAMRRTFLGKHYRDAWTTMVTVPTLDMDTTFGGLRAVEKGGGRQTTSLKMKAENGRQYVFRSVDKDPSGALEPKLRNTVVAKVLQDQTTTQMPYGAIGTDLMLNKLDILHPHPKLYILEQSNKLGSFQDYSGLLGMLEEHPTRLKNVDQSFADADKVLKSQQLFRELYDSPEDKIVKDEFARARLFDILVGDWGKHEGNWKWAGYEEGEMTTYRPIPRDRDHVFSIWDGVFPWLADREWAKASGENFGYKIKGLRSLTWQSRHLDRLLANELTREDWLTQSKYIQSTLTDDIIDESMHNMPEETYENTGKVVGAKIKQRLKDLDEYANRYYDMLAEEVDVVGTNEEEDFVVTRNSDGSTEVVVESTFDDDEKKLFYKRKFLPEETKEIRLFGLGDKDTFTIQGEADKAIRLRIIGGPGSDDVTNDSNVKRGGNNLFVYENSDKGDVVLGDRGKRVRSVNRDVYSYNRTSFVYDTYFPLALLAYNRDDGFITKAGVTFTNQRFDKKPYSTLHKIRTSFSTQGNFTFAYGVRFSQVLGKWDMLAGTFIGQPNNFTYFFGTGNNTEKSEELFDADFYRVRYNTLSLNWSLQRDFWRKSSFNIGLTYENNEYEEDDDNILSGVENSEIPGSEDINVIMPSAELDLDFRDNTGLPTKGIRLYFRHREGIELKNTISDFRISEAFIESYYPINVLLPTSLGLKFGGSKASGDVPYYKLSYLGQQNNLRGYLRNRFTGESTIYFNTDYRIHLLHWNNEFLPLEMGVYGFLDTGRVYDPNDISSKWHQGYGGGLFFYPLDYRRFTINMAVGFSEEEDGLFMISFGTVFQDKPNRKAQVVR